MAWDFPKRIYDDSRRLFPKGAVEVLLTRAKGPPAGVSDLDPTVRLVHKPTGIKVSCNQYPTQIENYAAAAIRLKIACDKRTNLTRQK